MDGLLKLLLASLLVAAVPAAAQTASYPARAVKIVVPFPPGGATDLMTRNVSQKMVDAWGQPVVVENRAGANGMIGAEVVAKAPGDGYTFLTATIAHAANVSLFPNAPYRFQKDLQPVAIFGLIPLVPVVRADSSMRSLQDLVAGARAGRLNAGSSGNGTASHLALELFKGVAKVNIQHVPYKGGAPAMTDLLGGQVDLIFALLPEALPHIRAGKLRALAVTSAERYPLLADVPTVAEAGMSGTEVTSWNGLMAPAGTPREVIMTTNTLVNRITGAAEMKARIIDQGFIPAAMSVAEAERFVAEDVALGTRDARSQHQAGLIGRIRARGSRRRGRPRARAAPPRPRSPAPPPPSAARR